MEKSPDWQKKMQEVFQVCSEELKKTTAIGKKMLSASKTNSCLHEAYEELGFLTAQAIKNNELNWENEDVQRILKTIEGCQSDLESMEEEVNDIRFSQPNDSKDSGDSKGS